VASLHDGRKLTAMPFRALLVTKDDQAAEVLAPVLSGFGLTAQCCGYSDAVCVVTEQKFQAVLVDFDDPHSAVLVLQSLASAPFETHSATIALLSDRGKVRNAFGAGANFVLYKPLVWAEAEATLRAVASLIKRERRNSSRVSVQVPVGLKLISAPDPIEGIMLDISEQGMDLLSAQPLYPSAALDIRFTLPDSPSEFELEGDVAWANPNGECGIRFTNTPESLRSALQSWIREHSKEAPAEEPDSIPDCKLSDLSLGGCYIETPSPFPERTQVLLTLSAEAVELQAQGLVRVMHPSFGMGVEFASRTAEQRAQTENFIQFLTSSPGVQPELRVSPQAFGHGAESFCAPSDDVDDALLDLLRNHESFSQEMFLETLHGQLSLIHQTLPTT
jgi:CheY-like chemotaxis protein